MDRENNEPNKHVDTTQTTHLGLCAGYGGIELGLKRVIPTLRTVALCEIEAFACANLVAKMEAGLMDSAPIWTDLKTFPWDSFRGKVDILTGGYPCQPFSSAGKRLGTEDPRHLWPFIADGIARMQPGICFFENVEGHITLGLSSVISDLEEMGYAVSFGIFSAAICGAPHQRKRVFILADRKSAGLERYDGLLAGCDEPRRDTSEQARQAGWSNSSGDVWPSRPGEPQHAWEPPRVVNSDSNRRSSDVTANPTQQNCDWQDNRISGKAGAVGNAKPMRCNTRIPGDGRAEKSEGSTHREESDRSDELLGNPNGTRSQERQGQEGQGIQGTHSDGGEDADGQAQPTLGGDTDGTANRLDNAELHVTCDNRTDELRLLGNGVVPATAERAFRTLATRAFLTP